MNDMTGNWHSETGKAVIRVKGLSERDRRRVLMHFLVLDAGDRMLRFGAALSDELITRYVQKLNFVRDAVFGVYDDNFWLMGVGHIGFAPKESRPALNGATRKARIAELGVSVAAEARGMGVGTKLFERAAIHCRNEDVDTLCMYCLSSNQTMMHIARKAGMEIRRDCGETDAYLTLAPGNPGSVLQEAFEEQFASFDYSFKANANVAMQWGGGYRCRA